MRTALRAMLAVIAALMALPGAAAAATPFTAGTGTAPSVAVGFDGSAHVVWMTGGSNAMVGYCRVGQSSESCDRTELLGFAGSSAANAVGRATVFVPSPGKVVIVAACWNCPSGSESKVFRWTSATNGDSFGAEHQIGTSVTGVELAGGTWIESAGLFVSAGGSLLRALSLPLVGSEVPIAPVGHSYDAEVVRVPGLDGLIAASNDLSAIGYRVYGGSLAASAINNPSNWNTIGAIPAEGATNSESSLNAGGDGVSLVYRSQLAGAARLALRRFDVGTAAFGAPHYIQGDEPLDAGLRQPDSYQDPSGRLHVVWRLAAAGGLLRYRAGEASGAGFGPVGTIASGENFTAPEIGVGNETGYAVWTQGIAGPVRVVRVEPSYDLPSGTPPPSGAGARPDVTRPTIGKRTLRPGEGTTFRFTSSVAGRALLTIEKRYVGLKGKRQGKGVCLARNKKRLRALRRQAGGAKAFRKRLKKLTRAFRRVGEIRRPARAGSNTIAFGGRVAGRKLGPGSYRAKLIVADPAGNASRAEILKFTVQAPKKAKAKKKAGARR